MKIGAYAWALSTILMFSSIPPAMATKICLKSKINGQKIYGELLSFTGRQWELTTDFGRLKLTIDDVFPCDDPGAKPPTTGNRTPDRVQKVINIGRASARPGATSQVELRIAGSNTVGAVLVPTLVTQMLKRNGNNPKRENPHPYTTVIADDKYRLRIEAKGSSTGFKALQRGQAEFAMSSRPIKHTEVAAIKNAGQAGMRDPGREIVLALDGVVPIVAASSKLKGISLHQLQQVFSGSVVNWRQLGLDNAPISVHARDDESGTFDTFHSLVLKPYGVKITANAKRYTSNEELAEEVATNPNAIGFVAAGALAKTGPGVRGLALQGDCGIVQEPNTFNIKTEDYALGRRLFLYSIRKDRTGLARDFVDFALSDAAQPHIVKAGFISQAIETLNDKSYLRRLSLIAVTADEPRGVRLVQRLRGLLRNAKRLSVTFRFQVASAMLDNKARQDGTRLARYLEKNAPKGELLLIGFADSTGDFYYNKKLSHQRAKQAEALLRGNGVAAQRMTTIGMSEWLPAFCNDTESGRTRNRRVEVWLR